METPLLDVTSNLFICDQSEVTKKTFYLTRFADGRWTSNDFDDRLDNDRWFSLEHARLAETARTDRLNRQILEEYQAEPPQNPPPPPPPPPPPQPQAPAAAGAADDGAAGGPAGGPAGGAAGGGAGGEEEEPEEAQAAAPVWVMTSSGPNSRPMQFSDVQERLDAIARYLSFVRNLRLGTEQLTMRQIMARDDLPEYPDIEEEGGEIRKGPYWDIWNCLSETEKLHVMALVAAERFTDECKKRFYMLACRVYEERICGTEGVGRRFIFHNDIRLHWEYTQPQENPT